MDSMAYWAQRQTKAQQRLTNRGIRATEAQLRIYYQRSQRSVIEAFIATYDHLLARAEEGKVTPADLYKLDKYWQLQAQLQHELQRMGDRQAAYLGKAFEKQYMAVYDALAIPGEKAFATLDRAAAAQMVNQIWCADGKSWSQRVWHNTTLLQNELNDKLIECVATGKKPSQLKKALQERFSVSYHRASTLVQTEMAHIQTQAAQKRYEDYGISEVEFWADPDERTCDVCGALHETRYSIHEHMPIPAHPNCRCCIVPVV